MDKTKAVLNLEELFGVDQPIVVRWQGAEYALKRPEAMAPEDYVRLSRLQATAAGIRQAAEVTEADAATLLATVDQMMIMIAPELAALQLPFMAKVRVLEFYIQQIAPTNAPKVGAPQISTGEASSPA
jgi:hypothetical protein